MTFFSLEHRSAQFDLFVNVQCCSLMTTFVVYFWLLLLSIFTEFKSFWTKYDEKWTQIVDLGFQSLCLYCDIVSDLTILNIDLEYGSTKSLNNSTINARRRQIHLAYCYKITRWDILHLLGLYRHFEKNTLTEEGRKFQSPGIFQKAKKFLRQVPVEFFGP